MHTAQELASSYRDEREARAVRTQEKAQLKQWAYQARTERTSKLSTMVSDPQLLILALRYYCQLPPGEAVSEPSLPANLTRLDHAHMRAARRILLIQWRPGSLRLPVNWRERLAAVGIELGCFTHPDELARFLALPADLTMDAATEAYAADHPELLQRAQAFLCGERQPAKQPRNTANRPTREPVQYKSLHEALSQPSQINDDDFYYYGYDDDCEPEEPAFNRQGWLKDRIAAFLANKA